MYHTETKLFYVSQFIEGIQLCKHLEQRQKKTKEAINDELLSFYMAQLIAVVEYIHQLDGVYVDFKPDNVLVTSDGNICVCVHDEGEAEFNAFNAASYQYTNKSYQAPEVIASMVVDDVECPNPHKTIWWSIGLFLYRLATGQNPFADPRSNQEKQNIMNKPLIFPSYVSKPLVSLLERLLQKDPKQRLTDALHIKSQPFFTAIDWNTICDFQQNKPPLSFKVEEAEPFFPLFVNTKNTGIPAYPSSHTPPPTPQSPMDYSPTPTWLAPVHADDLVGFTLIGANPTLL